MSTKGKPHPEGTPRDMRRAADECLAPEPTKLRAAIDRAAPDAWMFSNLALEEELLADGGPLALRALAEIRRLQTDLERTVMTLHEHARREQASKADVASGARKDTITETFFDRVLDEHCATAWAQSEAPDARGWKKAVAGTLGTRWSTLTKHLTKWGLTERGIVQRLKDWKPSR